MLKSPLNPKSKDIIPIVKFNPEKIIDAYDRIGIDVKKFFPNSKLGLYKCNSTGYRFYYPYECIGDENFYINLSKNRSNYYSARWEHFEALKFLNKEDEILEIGSGFGAFLQMLKKNGYQGKGLELNSNAVLECQEKDLDVKNRLIENVATLEPLKYDVVCSFQVLEHITQVNDFLTDSLKCLKVGGKMIIGVPNNNPYLFVNDKYHTLNLPPHHAGLWDKRSLKSLETLFTIKLLKMQFEPLENTYSYFIDFQMKNAKTKILRWILRILYLKAPRILKKFCCSFISGRNILVVFTKTS